MLSFPALRRAQLVLERMRARQIAAGDACLGSAAHSCILSRRGTAPCRVIPAALNLALSVSCCEVFWHERCLHAIQSACRVTPALPWCIYIVWCIHTLVGMQLIGPSQLLRLDKVLRLPGPPGVKGAL